MKRLVELSKNLKFKDQYILRQEEDKVAQFGFCYNCLEINSTNYKEDKAMRYLLLTSLPYSIDGTHISDIDLWECRNCTKCQDYQDIIVRRTMPTGNINAKYMIIGDAPGMGDGPKDTLDRVFVYGPSSKILRLALYELGIYHKCWFTNLLKCAKPNNVQSERHNIVACRNSLANEISIIEPEIIISLGNHVDSMLRELNILNDIKCHKVYHPSYFVRLGKNRFEYAEHINNELRIKENLMI
ncbi:MAG: uracil-DNA glycosylase family protein [Acidithiobacillus sp.]|uniref:uracil-DNA glycosylase family protein n=1 Tax=Acidithiobacillus sp. TaxID=1872118 RepID=UPI0035600898